MRSGRLSEEPRDQALTRISFTHDLNDLAAAQAVAESMYEEFKEPLYAPPALLRRMVAAGHLGRKSGRGFYGYEA